MWRNLMNILFAACFSAGLLTGAGARGQDRPDPTRVDELIGVLKVSSVDQTARWGAAIRELADLGKPAVPRLVAELDRTTDPRTIRYLGFALRTIGDPRAVPGLIRAIPRTLVEPGSDFGLKVDDAALKAFLVQHDMDTKSIGEYVSLGMPFREVTSALKTLTGHHFNEDELNFINLMGGPDQRLAQRRIFQRLAERWSVWWLKNRRRLTDDPAFALVNLPPLQGGDATPAGERSFPTGPDVKASGTWSNVILGPPQPQEYYRTFADLDSGFSSRWSADLPPVEKAGAAEVSEYARREGHDIQGIEFKPPGGGAPFYALRALDLRAWKVDNGRFGTIVEELRKGTAPDLGRPAGELLVDVDPATGAYRPEQEATFLFITREGGTGVLQVTGQITELFRQEDFGQPVGAKTTRGFYRGVQYQFYLVYPEGKGQPVEPAAAAP